MFHDSHVGMRAIEERDLGFLAECRNDPSTWINLGTIDFVNKEKQLAWWKRSSLDKSQANFILYGDGVSLGFVRTDEIDHIHRSIRVGGDIHPIYRGQGYGTKMYNLLFKYCFDYLNMNRVWLFVLDSNEAARTLYKKIGMVEEGRQREAIFRNGVYHDYIMMSILASEYRMNYRGLHE